MNSATIQSYLLGIELYCLPTANRYDVVEFVRAAIKTMKRIISKLIVMLLAFGVASISISAQHRHRHSRPQVPKRSDVQFVNDNQTTPEENAKIAEECSLSDKPKPETATKRPVFCGKAISLPKPPYPEAAKAAKVSGTVTVSAVMDEKGRVIWARAVSGHPLLQAAAVTAACRARYSPTLISGRAVKVETLITYNFVSQ